MPTNMASGTQAMTTSYWIKFFTEAGIPASDATGHAITFVDHRIQKDMLMDLNKEYLNDMGISMMGDVIAILKHAKSVHSLDAREKALKGTGPLTPNTTKTAPRRSTPASRTVNHYLRTMDYPDAKPMNAPPGPKMSDELAARLGPAPPGHPTKTTSSTARNSPLTIKLGSKQKEEVPVPKSRRVFPEHEGKYKIIMPSGTTEKTKKLLQQKHQRTKSTPSVFARLGAESSGGSTSPTLTVTLGKGMARSASATAVGNSVFKRLGGKTAVKRAATSTTLESDEDSDDGPISPLGYAGILKSTPSPAKKKKIQIKKTFTVEQRLGPKKEEPTSTTLTAGIMSAFTPKATKYDVKERLGAKGADSTSVPMPKLKKLNMTGMNSRLGPKKTAPATGIKKTVTTGAGVFGRLGKQANLL